MTTKIRHLAGSPRFILVATLALSILTIAIGNLCKLNRSDWPGWLQAVGSIWAILVAVWVSWQQAEMQQRREDVKGREEVSALLRSIRSELISITDRTNQTFGPELDKLTDGQPFFAHIPISKEPFTIYNALLPKIGTISDDTLRDQIVRTYRAAQGLVQTIHHHNELVSTWQDAIDTNRENKAKQCRAMVSAYTGILKESYLEVKDEIGKLAHMLHGC